MSALERGELVRMKEALAAFFAVPFNRDLSGPQFEAVFRYVKQADPNSHEQRRDKKLFDVVLPPYGWSLKTLVASHAVVAGQREGFEVVIQRCNIVGKTGASLDMTPPELGKRILRLWNDFLEDCLSKQRVEKPLCGLLLRERGNRTFAYVEHELRPLEPGTFKWKWAADRRIGLEGLGPKGVRLKWYHSGTQLFRRYRAATDAVRFSVDWRRLTFGDFLSRLGTRQ